MNKHYFDTTKIITEEVIEENSFKELNLFKKWYCEAIRESDLKSAQVYFDSVIGAEIRLREQGRKLTLTV